MALQIREETQNKKSTLFLKGEITVATAPVLDESISKYLGTADELVLDMSECDYTSSAGIRVLMSAYKKMRAREAKLRLVHVGETINEVLECTGLNTLFDIEQDA